MVAVVQQRLAWGERTSQPVRRIGSGGSSAGEAPRRPGPRCASVQGFSCHAHTAIRTHRRHLLEPLICSMARGSCALEHLDKTSLAIASSPAPIRGPMAPQAGDARLWHCAHSWRRSCSCRGSTSYTMGGVGRRTRG